MELTPNELWGRCIQIIRDNVTEQQFNTWFAHVGLKSYNKEKNSVVINVPSQFFYEYMEEHYSPLIKKTIIRVFGNGENVNLGYSILQDSENKITVDVDSDMTSAVVRDTVSQRPANQTPDQLATAHVEELDSQLRNQYSFDTFVEGESNRLARSIGDAISVNPAKTFNPFFVYGPSGCGKTHLVNAIGLRTKELHPELRVLYLSAHLFTVQYTDAVRQNKVNDFIGFYQTIDMLIIDDVQELSGKTSTQNTFFHIFNHLHLNNKQLILTADRPPVAIAGLEDRLLTRFKWGLQAEIMKPTEQMRYEILCAKVRRDGLDIPDNVLQYISKNIEDSVRDLEGVLNSLIAHSVVYNCDVSMQLVNKVMPGFVDKKKSNITIEDIKLKVAEYFNVSEEEICSKSRKQPLAMIRQMTIYLTSKLTSLSTTQIGQNVGGRNHATIIHSINQVKNMISSDEKVRKDVEEIKAMLKG